MRKCSSCPYSSGGSRNSLSDICDGCRNDPDTGWGGFTDHSLGNHFNSDDEREEYLRNFMDEEEE